MILALFLLVSYLAAAPLSCPADRMTVLTNTHSVNWHVEQKGAEVSISIPHRQFKGLQEVSLHAIERLSMQKKNDHWELLLGSKKPLQLRYEAVGQGRRLLLFEKDCLRSRDSINVVIDAGHGGKDPGAIGQKGLKEKHVTLAMALALREALAVYPDIKVFLTRKDDRYLGLRERVELARSYQPDVFISLHADSAMRKQAKGVSVYALSIAGASSEQARFLVEHENQETISKQDEALIHGILFQLTQTMTIMHSMDLGSHLLANVQAPIVKHKDVVDQAGFVVLKAFDVPSILVETGFISNPDEESKIQTKVYQRQLAKQLAKGIMAFVHANQLVAVKTQGYQVAVGDTLLEIAKRHNIALERLLKYNPEVQAKTLKVGQMLQIPEAA